ncbi:hypothetical protein D9M68_826510 [compost metagenome]
MLDTLLHLVQRIGLTSPTIHLRPAGNTRLDFMAKHVTVDLRTILLVMRHRVRARPDNGHIPKQHIDELRQFIQRSAADKGAHPGNAIVVARGLDHIRTILHHPHAAELPDLDRSSIDAVTLLTEENRPRGTEFHRKRDEEHGYGNQAKNHQGKNDIFNTLDDRLGSGHRTVEDTDGRYAVYILATGMQ